MCLSRSAFWLTVSRLCLRTSSRVELEHLEADSVAALASGLMISLHIVGTYTPWTMFEASGESYSKYYSLVVGCSWAGVALEHPDDVLRHAIRFRTKSMIIKTKALVLRVLLQQNLRYLSRWPESNSNEPKARQCKDFVIASRASIELTWVRAR